MEPTLRPRVKICCIGSVDEAWTAIRHGASALGLVSAMPSGPGVIDEVDLCSSVRTDGALDESKLERFFAALSAAG